MKNVSIREYDVYRNLDLSATGILIAAGPKLLFGYYLSNKSSSTIYVKFYNKATAPAVGTDTPILTLPIPAASAANQEFLGGIGDFPLGLGIGATTGPTDDAVGGTSTNDLIANVLYK